jgi:hypothetical protein
MRYFIPVICVALLAVSCKKEKVEDPDVTPVTPQLKMTVQPVFGAENLYIDSVYTTADGMDVQFTDVKFYMTHWGNGANELIEVARFDYAENGTKCFQVDGAVANFGALTGNIGVSDDFNHEDPSAFPSNSPLNIMNANGMHWSWASGYIFISLEGRADTISDGNPLFDHTFTYHIASDPNLTVKSFPTVTWTNAGNSLHTAEFKLDLKKIFDHPTNPIDVRSEYVTHSAANQAALTQKVLTNFLEALTAP